MMSILERRSTAELDERLQAELRREAPDGNLVREILRVLEEREKDYPAEITPQIQAAWDRFNDQEDGTAQADGQKLGAQDSVHSGQCGNPVYCTAGGDSTICPGRNLVGEALRYF